MWIVYQIDLAPLALAYGGLSTDLSRQTPASRDTARQSATSRDRARQVTSGTRSIAPYIEPAVIAISFGFGKKHGFMSVKIFLVSHGSNKNDTIAAVEKMANVTKE